MRDVRWAQHNFGSDRTHRRAEPAPSESNRAHVTSSIDIWNGPRSIAMLSAKHNGFFPLRGKSPLSRTFLPFGQRALSAHRRRPQSRSAMSGSRRFGTSRADRALSLLNNCNVRAPPPRIRRDLSPNRSHAADARRPSSLFLDASSAYHPLAAGPETRPQLLLVDLANASQRQLRNELDVFRRVSGSLSLLDEINQFSGRRRGVSSRNDESGDGFAPLVVGRAHHGDHKDARMNIEIVGLQTFQRRIAPEAILSALHERGLRRILIEGGAETVSRFLVANCLDRLHVVVAPIIIGSGRPSFNLPPIERVQEALRAPMKIHQLDGDVLFDCDLSAQRRAIGAAKTSMRPTRIDDFSGDSASRRCVSRVAILGSDC